MTRGLEVLLSAAGLGLAACQSLALDIVPAGDAHADAVRSRPDAMALPDARRDGTMPRDSGRHDAPPRSDASPESDGATFVCAPSSQRMFGPLLIGDTNSAYTSGVAARAASSVYLFDGLTPADAGSQIFVQPFQLSTDAGPARGQATLLYTPDAGPDLYLHDVATAPNGDLILLYGSGQWRKGRAASITTEGLLHALFLRPSTQGGSLSVISNVLVDPSNGVYGQAHAVWDDGAGVFHVSWQRRSGYVEDAGVYSISVRTFTPSGVEAGVDYGRVPVGEYVLSGDTEQGSVGAVGGILGVAYVELVGGGTPRLALLAGSPFSDMLVQAGPDAGDPPFVATAGTSQGLVYIGYQYNEPALTATLITIQDSGAGSVTSRMEMSANQTIKNARMVSDNAGGGVGVVVEYPEAIGFAYVSPGVTVILPGDAGIARSDGGATDEISIGSFQGSFVVALFNGASHQTTAAVGGCSPP
jgi:hypothetical protein